MSTFEQLRALLLRAHPIEQAALTPEATLESLGIDSLGVAELMFMLEDEFKVRLSPDPGQLTTVADVAAYIDGLIETQRATTESGGTAHRVRPAS